MVAVLGTVGRLFRTAALPAAGVPAVAASSQVTAFGTALGGVLLFSDSFSAVGVLSAVVAAGLGVAAVVAGTRWRLGRDLALAEALELRPHPGRRRAWRAGGTRARARSPRTRLARRPRRGRPASASTRRLSAARRATWGYSSDERPPAVGEGATSRLEALEPGDGVGHGELVVAHRPLVADDGERQLERAVGIGGGHRDGVYRLTCRIARGRGPVRARDAKRPAPWGRPVTKLLVSGSAAVTEAGATELALRGCHRGAAGGHGGRTGTGQRRSSPPAPV